MATNIEVFSKSNSYTVVGDTVIPSGEKALIDIEDFTIRELRNLRYIHTLGQIYLTAADRSILNKTLYDAAGLSVSSGANSGAVTSVNGLDGDVTISITSLGGFKESDLKAKVLGVIPSLDTVVATANTSKTKIDALEKDNTTNKTNISTLQTDVTKAKADITAKADKTAVASTDVIPEGTSKLYFTAARVGSAAITLPAGTATAVVTGDNFALCIAKLQKQIDALTTRVATLESASTPQ